MTEDLERLLATPDGRRQLRVRADVDQGLADRLLAHEADFRQPRRDHTLALVVQAASDDALVRHAATIAAGPGAAALWERLAARPMVLHEVATVVVAGDDVTAAEATLYLLVLDQLDPWGLGEPGRVGIAIEALRSPHPVVRGLAAEFLAAHAPALLLGRFDELVRDPDERVRGIVWSAALRLARADARDLALAMIGDEWAPLPQRRSALHAAGAALPTSDMLDVLTWLVVHPDPDLATDAANLLLDQHRHPTIAMAAQTSPHANVREIAEYLLDPYRGSPAAGGSRPGDPSRADATDIFEDMIRRLGDPS